MKKLLLVLSIALVFTLCAFAVTSCGDDHEHTWGTAYTVDKNASCTEAGQKSIKCTVCNEIMPGSEIEISASHTWSTELTVDKAASCTEAGRKSIKCTVCGVSDPATAVSIPASHSWGSELTVDKAASCTENGQRSIKCTACGESNAASVVVIPASHKWGSEVTVDRAATCSAEGQKSIKCTVCNQPNPATVTAIPTIAHEWNSKSTVDKAATCTEDGQESVKCKNCKAPDPESVKVIPAAHTWNFIPTVDVEATCTSDGQMSTKCKICKDIKPGSEIVITGGHKWDDAATVDFAATCTSDGQKSVKCKTCNESDPDSITVIEASHDYSEVYTKVYATAFNDGLREGVCAACQTPISEVIPQTAVAIITFKTSTSTYKNSVPLADALDEGEHFYPTEDDPDGKDLFVEYSILLNKTMDKLVGSSWAISGIRNEDSGNGNTPYWFYFAPNEKWCPFKGGFEADGVGELLFGAPCNDVTNPDGFVVLEDYYGWHRFGWKLHQDTYIEDGKVVYKMTTSLYVDGVKVHEMVSSNWLDENNLYFATIENGELVYSDNTNAKKRIFLFRLEKPYTSDGSSAYIPVADIYVTGGSDFVLPTLPVDDPKPDVYEVSDVELDGKSHFTVTDFDATQPHDHVWSNIATIDRNATCSVEGQKSYKCAICGEIDESRVVNIPKNANHFVEKYTTILEGTIFSQGLKEGNCSVCGILDSKIIPKTNETVRKLTSTSPSRIVHNYDMLEVLNGDHFYPTEEDPDGKDLYIELSLLWNESLLKTSSGLMNIGRISLSNTNDGNGFYYLNFVDEVPGSDCSYSGGFESGSKSEVLTGPSLENGGNKSAFPFIGEYGWHRIGVRVHQEVSVSDGRVVYEVTSYLYVDGEVVSSQICDVYDTNLLYYAVIGSDGELEYHDNDQNSRYIYAFRLDGFNTANADDSAYLITADVHVTCGNDFVVPVEKADSPVAKDYVTNGETFDGTVHFDCIVPDDIVFPAPPCQDHVDADDDGVCDSEGCTYICIDGCDTKPCADADDDGFCDSKACNNPCIDGCDAKPCVDKDYDGFCDNENCDKPTTNKPTTCEHDTLSYRTTAYATMFSKGEGVAYCPVCEEDVLKTLDETVPTIEEINASDNALNVIKDSVPFEEILDGGKHFYPTSDDADGNDLLIEFSMLLNGTMDNIVCSNIAFPGVDKDSAHWLYIKTADGITKGYFDYWNSNAKEQVYNANPSVTFDGWYRFGVRYHQNTHVDTDVVSYDMTVTLYINGVRVHEYVQKCGNDKFVLYTATVKDGVVSYADNTDRSALVYNIGNAYLKSGSDEAYIPVADTFVSCADDFVMNVELVSNPAADTFELPNGSVIDAKTYFDLVSVAEITCSHVDANDDGECDNPGCDQIYFDGCDVVDCEDVDGDEVCDNTGCTKPVKAPVPAVCDHVNLPYVTTVYPTVFSTGVKTAHCDVCGEDFTEQIDEKAPLIIRRTSSNTGVLKNGIAINELLDEGEHFYPTEDDPDGKSLFVEYSILLNETLDLAEGACLALPGFRDSSSGNSNVPFWFYFRDGYETLCPFKGGFEVTDYDKLLYGKELKNTDKREDHIILDDYYGWHRFVVEFHQNTRISGSSVKYSMTITLYIDGVKLSSFEVDEWQQKNLLYTAKIVNGKLSYSDSTVSDRYLYIYRIEKLYDAEGEIVYLPIADLYVSCADKPLLNVTPVTDPEDAYFEVESGVSLFAPVHFEYNQ